MAHTAVLFWNIYILPSVHERRTICITRSRPDIRRHRKPFAHTHTSVQRSEFGIIVLRSTGSIFFKKYWHTSIAVSIAIYHRGAVLRVFFLAHVHHLHSVDAQNGPQRLQHVSGKLLAQIVHLVRSWWLRWFDSSLRVGCLICNESVKATTNKCCKQIFYYCTYCVVCFREQEPLVTAHQ